MAARHGGVCHHQLALLGGATDHHALRGRHQLVERHVEAVLLASRIGALEMQDDLRHDPGRGLGRATRCGPDMKDMDSPADILEGMLAAIDESIVDSELGDVLDRARHSNATGLGNRLDARGEVDAVAEDVLVLRIDDDLAKMNADAEHHALAFVQRLVEARHALLDVDRCTDRRHRRRELGQHCVACRADQAAAAGLDGRPPDVDLRRLQVAEGAGLGALHHAGEAGEIGMDDGGEATLHGPSLAARSRCRARP